MANKRTLKHAINLICEELFSEAVAASLYGKEQHQEDAEALVFSIIKMRNNYISRISHAEPGMKPKVYFSDLRENFNAEVGDMADQINNL